MAERRVISSDYLFEILCGNVKEFLIYNDKTILLKDLEVLDFVDLNFQNSNLTDYKIHFGENCIFKEEVYIGELNINHLSFRKKCVFEKEVVITDCTISSSVKMHQPSFNGGLSFDKIEAKSFSIHKGFFKSLEFIHFKIESGLEIHNCNVLDTLKLSRKEDDAFTYVNTIKDPDNYIKSLIILNSSNVIVGNDELQTIENINLIGFTGVKEKIELRNINLNEIKFSHYKNNGTLVFHNVTNIKGEGIFDSKDSDLGELTIKNSNLSNFKFLVESSKLDNISILGTEPPKPKNINPDNPVLIKHTSDTLLSLKKLLELKGDLIGSSNFLEYHLEIRLKTIETSNFKEKKDIYSQLKKMYEQRGDSVRSLDYQAKELEIYRKSITWGSHFFEKFNLSINRFTNNYGTNWALALLVTILINSVFFTWYCILLGFTFDIEGKYFWELFSYSFEFLNPLRKADFIPNMKVTPGARIVDYSARILVTLCVYQLIQAFRKYGKK